MPSPLLLTKFYVPHLRAEHVLRPRLTRRLDDVLARRLTLVCAPAGYGKTTLIAEWVADRAAAGAPGPRQRSTRCLAFSGHRRQ